MFAYLDNSATTRPFDEVTEKMTQINSQIYGNPSSLHSLGMEAEKIIKEAKDAAMQAVGAKKGKFIFTSGGTEADNLAILGTLYSGLKRRPKLVTTKMEHPAVLEPCAHLARLGADCRYVGVDTDGCVDLDELEQSLEPDTALVSVMLVNNEVGSIQPILKIAKMVRRICADALFHVDAVQGFGKIPIDVEKLDVDLLTISGHKINGPKGIGGLFVRHPNRLKPIIFGGHQEENFRSGTQNTPAIGGFMTAICKSTVELAQENNRLCHLRDRLLDALRQIPDCKINGGDRVCSAPHIVNVSFKNVKSEVLLHSLERCGVFVSTGSACSSNKPALSPVLLAMGLRREEIDSAIRISLGADNTEEQMDYAVQVIREEVEQLRELFL